MQCTWRPKNLLNVLLIPGCYPLSKFSCSATKFCSIKIGFGFPLRAKKLVMVAKYASASKPSMISTCTVFGKTGKKHQHFINFLMQFHISNPKNSKIGLAIRKLVFPSLSRQLCHRKLNSSNLLHSAYITHFNSTFLIAFRRPNFELFCCKLTPFLYDINIRNHYQ